MVEWEVFLHPAYSPDLARWTYHLFRSMQHALTDAFLITNESENKWIKMACFKRQLVLSSRNPTFARKMEKSSRKQ